MAPPLGIRIPELRFDSEGRWFIDGELIEHARSCDVMTKNLRVVEDGSFVTSIGREVAPVKIDDVAFFVVDAELVDGALRVALSDDTSEALPSPTLALNEAGQLYVRVKSEHAWARFKRGAQQRLEPYWREEGARVGLAMAQGLIIPSPLRRV